MTINDDYPALFLLSFPFYIDFSLLLIMFSVSAHKKPQKHKRRCRKIGSKRPRSATDRAVPLLCSFALPVLPVCDQSRSQTCLFVFQTVKLNAHFSSLPKPAVTPPGWPDDLRPNLLQDNVFSHLLE